MKTMLVFLMLLASLRGFAQTQNLTGDLVSTAQSKNCFCSPSGKLLTADKKIIELCFGTLQLPDLKNVSLKGHYEHKTVPQQVGKECDEYGEKDVFVVESFTLKGKAKQIQTLEGSYRSMEGVMNKISCYCGNGGYLTTKDKKEIAICLDYLKVSDFRPKKLKIIGFYTEKTIPSTANSPCPAGTMTIFQVLRYE